LKFENWNLKQWALSHLILSGIIILAIIQLFSVNDPRLKISVLDVGQGDSILIRTPEHKNIIIDAGEGSRVIEQLGNKINFFDKTIDLAIITHPHKDHFGGFLEILQKYPVKRIMLTGAVSDDPANAALLSGIKALNIPVVFPQNNSDLRIGRNVYLDIIYPFAGQSFIGQKPANANNVSIVAKLVADNRPRILLVGDAESQEETEILLSGQNVASPVLKLGHHGSRTATSDSFLSAVSPETAVISVGKDNKFGHPHAETMEKIKNLDVRETMINGTVEFDF
jgi:competence protein ComEC